MLSRGIVTAIYIHIFDKSTYESLVMFARSKLVDKLINIFKILFRLLKLLYMRLQGRITSFYLLVSN